VKRVFLFFEKVLTSPKGIEWIIPILLYPLSLLYCGVVFLNSYRKYLFRRSYNIPIIGVANLVLGGSGKTPLVIAIAKQRERVAVVLRGYGRKSKGTLLVSKWGEVLENVESAGDEAMLYSSKLPTSSVIVSEDRIRGIELAKEIGAEIVILDDSYRQHHILKDIEFLIEVNQKNRFCLPAGGYREKLWIFRKDVRTIREGLDFTREVYIDNPTDKMVLITAIAKPERLDKYIPNIPKYHFPDHHRFTKKEILEILEKEKPKSILTTEKDYPKLQPLEIEANISLIQLEINLNKDLLNDIRRV